MKVVTIPAPWGIAVAHHGVTAIARAGTPSTTLLGQRIAIRQGHATDADGLGQLVALGVDQTEVIDGRITVAWMGSIVATATLIGWVDARRLGDVQCVGEATPDDVDYDARLIMRGGAIDRRAGPVHWILGDVIPMMEPLLSKARDLTTLSAAIVDAIAADEVQYHGSAWMSAAPPRPRSKWIPHCVGQLPTPPGYTLAADPVRGLIERPSGVYPPHAARAISRIGHPDEQAGEHAWMEIVICAADQSAIGKRYRMPISPLPVSAPYVARHSGRTYTPQHWRQYLSPEQMAIVLRAPHVMDTI